MVKVKKQYADVVIGFNGSSSPLGVRNDLHKLYAIAKAHNLKRYLDMLEETTEKEVETAQVHEFEQKQQAQGKQVLKVTAESTKDNKDKEDLTKDDKRTKPTTE